MESWRGWQSMFFPAGPQGVTTLRLFWAMLVVGALVYLAVIAAMVFVTARARRRARRHEAPPPDAERRMARAVVGATALSTVILLAVLGASVFTGRALATVPPGDPISIIVRGRQWWWEFEYEDTLASRRLVTANELHVPVGRPVVLKLMSPDVIHSFWVPNLDGKKDAIPGHVTRTWFRADTAGVYRGECAEFCGHQHAKMAFVVVAESPAEFAAWYERELQPAAQPADSLRARGLEVFQAATCAMCHTIRGTPTGGTMGPDLTHVGSRRTIAAGTLSNTRGNLAGWIVDPQAIKPGSHMPPNGLRPEELHALLSYLEGLR